MKIRRKKFHEKTANSKQLTASNIFLNIQIVRFDPFAFRFDPFAFRILYLADLPDS